MMLENLMQAPLCTTFMGVAHGALSYYRIPITDSMVFGASGHGFAINIHDELCPSSPYVWNKGPVLTLMQNLGVRTESLGLFTCASSPDDRSRVEAALRVHLDAGHPCALLNLENQLITGYEDGAFMVSQPWPGRDWPPKTLTFDSWWEFGNEVHVEFYAFTPGVPAPIETVVSDSLRYAVRAWRSPGYQTTRPCGFGPDAYDIWMRAIQSGRGASHGNWWNGMVWSECRRYLGGYFHEIGHVLRLGGLGDELAWMYNDVSGLLAAVAEKDRASEDKLDRLKAAKDAEEKAVSRIEAYLRMV